jgi:hypothetical protein
MPTSRQNLRLRVRYHFRGNAEGSTLRLTLGCLIGLQLRRVGSGNRLTFTPSGEAKLSEWMGANAFVCWHAVAAPWEVEHRLIRRLSLPLNLDGNDAHSFYGRLSDLRRQARIQARELPIWSATELRHEI